MTCRRTSDGRDETSDESEDEQRAGADAAESPTRRRDRDAGSPAQKKSGDVTMAQTEQDSPRSAPRAGVCVNCGVYEFVQALGLSTDMCCWTLRGERCVFPDCDAGRGTSDGSDDGRAADVGEAESLIRRHGREMGLQAKDASGGKADGDDEMRGRRSSEQGGPVDGDEEVRRDEADGYVCVECAEEHADLRTMVECSRCEAYVCDPRCAVRCQLCDAVTCGKCACRCGDGAATCSEDEDEEDASDDDARDDEGESWGCGGWYRGMPEDSDRKSYYETYQELRTIARQILCEVTEWAIAADEKKCGGGEVGEDDDQLLTEEERVVERKDGDAPDGKSGENCRPCQRHLVTAAGRCGACLWPPEHQRPELQAAREATVLAPSAAQRHQPDGR